MNRLAVTKIIRNKKEFTVLIALDERRRFQEFQIFEAKSQEILNQIYIARVERVVPGIQAAFVQISPNQKCYLPLEKMEGAFFTRRQSERKLLCEGDELVVQVTRDAVKTKDPIVSTKLMLTGRYSILTSENTSLGISKKISGEIRQKLSDFLKKVCIGHEQLGYGILLRTNCTNVNLEELEVDIQNLIQKWKLLLESAPHQSAYTLLVANTPGYIHRLQSIVFHEVDKLYTDDFAIYEEIGDYLPYLKEQQKLEFYQDDQVSLSALYHIQGNLENLLDRRVWLPSGGNLIIEHVEAMTVIDVNSARITKSTNTALEVNKEAAREIPRQLKLRNISGIILIDFINVEDEQQEEEFLSLLKAGLREDPIPTHFIDITKLGLVEITRKKVQKSLREIITS